MVFWIAILAGVLFVWLAVRLGFYETWVLLFNVVISIYVAIFLAPVFTDLASTAGGSVSYGTALSLLVLAGGCFAALHGLSYVFLTGQFSIPFPRLFDILLSGLLGFVAGFLILSFLALVVTTTPLAQRGFVSTIGLNRQSQQTNLTCVAWCCDKVHSLSGSESNSGATLIAIDRLLTERPSPGSDPNQPDADDPIESVMPTNPPAGEAPSRTGIRSRPRPDPTRAADLD